MSPVSASAPASPKATMSQITAADMPSGYRVIGHGHGEQLDCETMWCPSATLSVWANAWLAGKAAPDDVLDALSCWAPIHSVTAYDSVAAGHTGLPWPDIHDAGAVSLLQTLRTAAGWAVTRTPSIRVALPVPGDVRGLAPGTQFERDALATGEAVIVTHPDDPGLAVGLVPEFGYDESDDELVIPELCALSWTVYSLPGAPVIDHIDLGEAEYTLRSAVRSAATALSTIGLGSAGVDVDDPRGLVEQLLESTGRHQVPEPAGCWRTRRTLTRSSRSAPGSPESARSRCPRPRSPPTRCDHWQRSCGRRERLRSARFCTQRGRADPIRTRRHSAADGTARR